MLLCRFIPVKRGIRFFIGLPYYLYHHSIRKGSPRVPWKFPFGSNLDMISFKNFLRFKMDMAILTFPVAANLRYPYFFSGRKKRIIFQIPITKYALVEKNGILRTLYFTTQTIHNIAILRPTFKMDQSRNTEEIPIYLYISELRHLDLLLAY